MITFSRPVTALMLAPSLVLQVVECVKRNTVRGGWRDYRVGDHLYLVCPEHNWTSPLKYISSVRHCTVRTIPKADYEHQGWASREDMLGDLRRFYPDMKMSSKITVIWWGILKPVLEAK
jgi:hypothetical protein